MTSSIKYGDIILMNFSPQVGAEISKKRPCIVISHNLINQHSPFIIVIPLTTNTERVLPYHLSLKPSKSNGLSQASKALPEQLKSMDKKRFLKKIGNLKKPHLNQLEQKIRLVINQELWG